MCETLTFLLDNSYSYIKFGTKIFRQIVGIPMVTNCAPFVADLFLFYYERDSTMSLFDKKKKKKKKKKNNLKLLQLSARHLAI